MDKEARLFEEKASNVEKDRSKLIILISGIAVFIMVGLIVLQQVCGTGAVRTEMSRPGSAEFDSYRDYLVISNKDMNTYEVQSVKYGRIKCRIQNAGDRTVIGLELHAAAVGLDNQEYPRKELPGKKDAQGNPLYMIGKDVTIIPSDVTGREELGPGQVMEVEINLERIPDPAQLMDMTVAVSGVRLK